MTKRESFFGCESSRGEFFHLVTRGPTTYVLRMYAQAHISYILSSPRVPRPTPLLLAERGTPLDRRGLDRRATTIIIHVVRGIPPSRIPDASARNTSINADDDDEDITTIAH